MPLSGRLFDLVVSEHGAAAGCDPERWLPEAARLLRPAAAGLPDQQPPVGAVRPGRGGVGGDRLLRGQREAYRVQWPGGGVEFHPSHGDWVGLLRGPASSSRPCTSSTRHQTGTTTPSTRSCREWATRWPAVRIFFTGGSGKAGRHVAPYLAEQGHQVTNADLVPLGHPDVADLRVDLTDAGETYSALAGLARGGGTGPGAKSPPTTLSCTLPLCRAILLASDARDLRDERAEYLQRSRGRDTTGRPQDCVRVLGDDLRDLLRAGRAAPALRAGRRGAPDGPGGLLRDVEGGRRGDRGLLPRPNRCPASIYGLRINNVIEPEEYAELFPPSSQDPSLRRRNLFAYIDTRDLAQLTLRCLETDGLGFEIFNVANADMSVAATTPEVIERFYAGVEVRREMGRDETFYCIDKARNLLGYRPQHSWRERPTPVGQEDRGLLPPHRRDDVPGRASTSGVAGAPHEQHTPRRWGCSRTRWRLDRDARRDDGLACWRG